MPDGPKQEARDEIFLSQLGQKISGPFPSKWTCPQVQPWLYGYNAFEEVRKAVEEEPFRIGASKDALPRRHPDSLRHVDKRRRSFAFLTSLKRWLAV